MNDLFSAAEANDEPGAAASAAAPAASPITMDLAPASEPTQFDALVDAIAARLEYRDEPLPENLMPDFREVKRQLKPATPNGKPNLLQRILAAQAAVAKVDKDRKNTEQNYKYSSVDEIVGASRMALIEAGIFVHITPSRKRAGEYKTGSGKSGRQVEAFSTVTVMNAEDPEELLQYEISGFVQAVGDKQEWVLSAQFRKYALIELLNLERGTADDQEAQRGSDDVASRGSYQRPQQRSSSAPPAQRPNTPASADRQPARPVIGGDTTTRDMMIRALQSGAPKAGGKPISEAQVKRLFAVAKDAGYSREQVVDSLGDWFRLTPPELPWQLYDGVVQLFAKYPTSQREAPPAPAENEADLDVE